MYDRTNAPPHHTAAGTLTWGTNSRTSPNASSVRAIERDRVGDALTDHSIAVDRDAGLLCSVISGSFAPALSPPVSRASRDVEDLLGAGLTPCARELPLEILHAGV